MKKLITCLMMLLQSLLLAYAQYNVTAINATNETVTMRCVGYGKKAVAAAKDAELSAIRTLLFEGVTNTRYTMPLISEDRLTVEAKFRKFFDDFYNGGYKDFIESSVVAVPFGKNDLKQKCIVLDVCVRVPQLRRYLENKDSIRKFGL